MKKMIALLCIFVSLLLCGCSAQQQNYVKNIIIEKNDSLYKMIVVSYDFSSEQEAFKEKTYYSDNIFLLGCNVLKEDNYNLRLCEACYLTSDMFDEINQVVYMLNSIKFPPASSVICLQDGYFEKIADNDKFISCYSAIYNLESYSGKVSGTFPIIDKNGKNTGMLLVHMGVPVKILNKKQMDVFNIISNTAESIDYSFWENQIYAGLNVVDCYFSSYDNKLILNVNLFINNIVGINNYMQNTEFYINILKYELEEDIRNIFSDPVIKSVYNLQWFPDLYMEEYSEIDIKLNII